MKRILALIATVSLAMASIFASTVTVNWEWLNLDDGIKYFRYQIDGEDEELWTVVDSSVTSYSAEGLDGSVAYTLYLQQSYDGETWSASASSTSMPVEEFEVEEPVEEEVPEEAPIEEPVEEVAEEPEPVVEAPVVAPVEEVVEPTEQEILKERDNKNNTKVMFTLGFGYDRGIMDGHDIGFVEAGIRTENLVSMGTYGFGLEVSAGGEADMRNGFVDTITDIDLIAKRSSYDFALRGDAALNFGGTFNKFRFDILGGARVAVDDVGGDSELSLGLLGGTAFRFGFSKHFALGLGVDYVYYFMGERKEGQTLGGNLYLSYMF